MPKRRTSGRTSRTPARKPHTHVTLQMLADYVGFAPATVSLVMNRSAAADSIPQRTKELIRKAAAELNYHPNFAARSLRTQRTFSVGVVVPEISEGYEAMVLSGIEDYLLRAGYFYFVVCHRHRTDLIDEYPKLLLGRSVEGIIAVDTPWKHSLPIPVVTVSGHHQIRGVTNVMVDHDAAAELALRHLIEMGHRRVAIIKGQEFSSDTELRWNAITLSAQRLGLPIIPALVKQLKDDTPTPELGYRVTRKLLAAREPFTAMFAFNDITAIGAIHALKEAGLDVPNDVSVVGFDDIQSAAFQNPALTTVRQPLRTMGKIAAETLLNRIGSRQTDCSPNSVVVEPELIVRGSTGPAPADAVQPQGEAGTQEGGLHTPQDGAVERLIQETGLTKAQATKVLGALARFLVGELH